jgi:calcineurin-like phosphoesterase family protein
MDKAIIDNWNSVVSDNDTVYHLGDWTLRPSIMPYLKLLNGQIICIHGSHDRFFGHGYKWHSDTLYTKTHAFKLIHDPKYKGMWNSWVIHGHHHNNHLHKFPFINGKAKTINVSVELIGYKPLDLEYLEGLDIDSIEYMRDINSPICRYEEIKS